MKGTKALISSVTGVLSALLGALYIPVTLMVLVNIIDYITGLMVAPQRGGISSYKSMQGIFKKVSMWLLVVVGAIIDKLLLYAASTAHINVKMDFLVAAIVAIWIICNEIISILENIVDLGVNIPPFLMPIVEKLKAYTEKEGAINEEENSTDK